MFGSYLKLGFDHILDINGYDHILFVLTLCAIYVIKDWKKVLILVTAFTIGHSITLALSALDILVIPATIIEVLIPITIILTAVYNIFSKQDHSKVSITLYLLPLFFGLIHGMGFSYFFKALLSKDESILTPLLPFNLGVELGQIVVVLIGMFLSYLFVNVFNLKQKYWNYFISISAIVISSYLLFERL